MKCRNGLLVALTGLVSVLVLLAAGRAPAADHEYMVPAGGTTAVRAVDFLNSTGVCVHVQHHQPAAKLAGPLKYVGLRNIRDGADKNYDMSGLLLLHEQAGVTVTFGPGSGAREDDLPKAIAACKQLAAAGALLAVEGPNEPNNFGGIKYEGQQSGVENGTWMPVAKFQRDLYRAVKNDPVLAKYPVFGSSEMGAETDNVGLQFLTIPSGAKCLMPDGTKYADYANVHNYVSGHLNGRIDNQAFKAAGHEHTSGFDDLYGNHGNTWRKHFTGYSVSELATLPKVTTETGWRTDNTPAGDDFQGKMFMNVFLAQYKSGWKHTFLYEFTDDADGAFGFVKGDLTTTRKSATYFHNFTSILADTDSLPTPGKLGYSIPHKPDTVHELLMQKSDGTFELAVWGEQLKGTNSVTVNLGGTYGTVKIYDPTIGTAPTQTLSNVSSVPLTLSDHVMIIELKSSPVVGLMSVSTALAAEKQEAKWVDVTPPKSADDTVQIVAAIPGQNKVVALSGTPHNGALDYLWSTTDKGATWKRAGIGAGSDPLHVFPLGLLLDPADPNTFWLWGNWIKFEKDHGNYKTNDGGTTIHSYLLAEFEGLSVDFSDPQRKTMVAGRHESSRAVERSTDGGKHWTTIGQTLPAGSADSEYPLVIDSQTYLIGCSFNKYGPQTLKGKPGIFRTTDGGRHWVSVCDKQIFQQPLVDRDTIYWAYYNGTDGGLLKSTDKGVTWTEITPSGLAYTAQPIVLPNGNIAAITATKVIAVSKDGSAPWTKVTPLIPLSKPYGLTYNAVGNAFFVWQKNGSVQRLDYTITAGGALR